MLPAQEALEERIAFAPALRQARMQVGRLGALVDLENAKRVPDITVNAGIKRSQDSGRNQAVIGISVPLPFFDTNRGNIAELQLHDFAIGQRQPHRVRRHHRLAAARGNAQAHARHLRAKGIGVVGAACQFVKGRRRAGG